MLNEGIPTLLIATLLGTLSGLGVGGGSLLILWLTLVLHTDPEQARIMNLLFFIPCALVASLFRWKQGRIDRKAVIPAIIAGCILSTATILLTDGMDTGLFRKCFGILLIFTGIRELTYRDKKPK